ncbi:MAG: tetratricopeptide repeat-containing serine/threonine-protein kinase, partial [Pirellulales bacterium]|nr:tetratricopeptide repeat-containing serine/threonine-protein kinase [Pirellulales bacterium]
MACNELALWIFQRLAAALAHSHARGVLHGDLKPANVLIRNDGEPALLDFNLSQSLDSQYVKHIGGTLPYMAPECYRGLMGQVIELSVSSDLYGLGVMLFEFVTGRRPYPSPRSSAAIDLEPAIASRRQPPQWKTEDDVSPGLRAIIDQCLAFDSKQRYGSAEALQEDLRREFEGLPLVTAREPRQTRMKKWIRRHPRLISGSSVALVLLAMLIPVSWWARVWYGQSTHLATMAHLKAFEKDSSHVLSAMMANPLRHREVGIEFAIEPLDDYGLLDESRQHEFESPQMTPEQAARHRGVALLHVTTVAMAEIDWLRARHEGTVNPDKLERLNRLVDAAQRLQGDQPSRACLFIQAERARLGGDGPAYKRLHEQFEQTGIGKRDHHEMYLEAYRLMLHRRWARAREYLVKLADLGTVPPALRWTSLGRSQYHQGQYDDAVLSFTQAMEHAPLASRLWLLRGLCFYKQRKYLNAEDDFTEAIEREETMHRAWINRGLVRSYLPNKQHDAISDYNRALELSPGNAHVLILRSRSLAAIDQHAEAERDYQRALAAEKLTPTELFTRSQARMENGDFEGSLSDLERA